MVWLFDYARGGESISLLYVILYEAFVQSRTATETEPRAELRNAGRDVYYSCRVCGWLVGEIWGIINHSLRQVGLYFRQSRKYLRLLYT